MQGLPCTLPGRQIDRFHYLEENAAEGAHSVEVGVSQNGHRKEGHAEEKDCLDVQMHQGIEE